MPNPVKILEYGDSLVTLYDDGSRMLSSRGPNGMWFPSGAKGGPTVPPGPKPKPDPGAPDPSPPPPSGAWVHPLRKKLPYTTYDWDAPNGSHYLGAIDIGAGPGGEMQLYAPLTGRVLFAGWEGGGGGNVIVIENAQDGAGITMAHLNAIHVNVGQKVTTGQKIGITGWTGSVIPAGPGGAHLHLEVRRNGAVWGSFYRAVPYFASKGVAL